jgi:dihydrofolate reductase
MNMGRIVVSEFVTLDGVMEDPGGAEKSRYGGWAFRFDRGPEGNKFKFDELFAADALLLGRVTYQGFAAAWPGRTDEAGFANRMNNLPKYVVSTTLERAEWNNSRLIRSNVVDATAKLKEMPGGDILVAGSGQLVQTLMQHSLVDEFRLMVFPIVVGGGKRLFQEGSGSSALRLVEEKTVGSGVLTLVYQLDKK